MDFRSSNSEDHPRKRLRKGTRSCVQCRQRRVRCAFEANASSCNNCLERSHRCLKQGQGKSHIGNQDTSRDTYQRIQQLERTVEDLCHQQLRDASSSLTHAGPSAGGLGRQVQTSVPHHLEGVNAFTPSSNESDTGVSCSNFNNAPLLELFNHEQDTQDMHKTRQNKQEPSWKHSNFNHSDKKIMAFLKAHAPDTRTMKSILIAGWQPSSIWHAAFPTAKANDYESEDTRTIHLIALIYSKLHSDATHEVVKFALCLALQLQQLPLADATTLPFSSELLQHQFISSIETLFSGDGGLVETIHGLECMLMLIGYYINAGNMRKVWLTVHRATTLAQLLSLHDSTNELHKGLWSELWQLDRGFSLILGLPYACPEVLLPDRSGLEAFLCRLGVIGGHIIDRNLDRSKKQTYSITMGIDEELEECKNMMPHEWWDSIPAALDEARAVFEAKMRLFSSRKLLHLPFMLTSYTDSRYSESRVAALQSATAMIEVFRVLRDAKRPLMGMCEMADFQVFTAALTVAVDLLMGGGGVGGCDWELVGQVGTELKRLSELATCKVAAKGAQVLDELCKARQNRATSAVFAADIPYFGNIRIRLPGAIGDNHHSGNGPELSEDSWLYPYGDTQPWCDGLSGMFDIAMGNDWWWSMEHAATLEGIWTS